MDGFVTTAPREPVVPKQTVTLELTVEEFAVLEHLRWHYLSGWNDLRAAVDSTFGHILDELDESNRRRVESARRPGFAKARSVVGAVREEFSA